MGCQGSSNNRNKAVKKNNQYKGMFKDKVIEDVEKRKQVSHSDNLFKYRFHLRVSKPC